MREKHFIGETSVDHWRLACHEACSRLKPRDVFALDVTVWLKGSIFGMCKL